MELQTGEIPVEISVDDLRLIIRHIIRLWNWGVIKYKYYDKQFSELEENGKQEYAQVWGSTWP